MLRRALWRVVGRTATGFVVGTGCVVLVIGMLRLRHGLVHRISTPEGIQESGFIELGGVEQFVSIRGRNAPGPALIFLHGGPGFPLTFLWHRYQPLLESNYTVVHWEQRLCGRTFYRNRHLDSSGVDVQTLVADLDQLIQDTKARLQPDSIILLGQSWGSVLAWEYMRVHPGSVDGYVGVGQVVDFDAGKRLAAETALDHLPRTHPDAIALRESLRHFAGARRIEDLDVSHLETLITGALANLESGQQLSGVDHLWLGLQSPQLSINDVRWFLRATNTADILALQHELVQHMYFDFDAREHPPGAETRVCFIQGSTTGSPQPRWCAIWSTGWGSRRTRSSLSPMQAIHPSSTILRASPTPLDAAGWSLTLHTRPPNDRVVHELEATGCDRRIGLPRPARPLGPGRAKRPVEPAAENEGDRRPAPARPPTAFLGNIRARQRHLASRPRCRRPSS